MKNSNILVYLLNNKIIILVILFNFICICSYSQSKSCIKDIFLKIPDKDGNNTQIESFEIFFKIKDSIFNFKKGDFICIDSGKTKPCIIFFFYENRLISCPIDLDYNPERCYIQIDYYKSDLLYKASFKECRKWFGKCSRKTNIIYFEEAPYNYNLVQIPAFFWNNMHIKEDRLFYGVVRINVGRTYYTFDWKEIYKPISR